MFKREPDTVIMEPWQLSCPESNFLKTEVDSDNYPHSDSSDMMDLDNQSYGSDDPAAAIIGNDSGLSWAGSPPSEWDMSSVSFWLYNLAEYNHAPNLPQRYFGWTGPQLAQASYAEMEARDPEYGALVKREFDAMNNQYFVYTQQPLRNPPLSVDQLGDRMSSFDLFKNIYLPSGDLDERFPSIKTLTPSTSLQLDSQPPNNNVKVERLPDITTMVNRYSCSEDTPSESDRSEDSGHVSFTDSEIEEQTPPRPRRRRNRSRGGPPVEQPRLWKFILQEMLGNEEYNPSIIKWEDRSQGIFRVMDSGQIAKLWGIKKKNPKMTYEKLARALRYIRKEGILQAMPAGSRLPKKLVFRFSDQYIPH